MFKSPDAIKQTHRVILEPCPPAAFGFKPLRQKDLQGKPLRLLPTCRGTSHIITTESLQVILAKGTTLSPNMGWLTTSWWLTVALPLNSMFKEKEWEAGLHLQVIDPFLRQYNNYRLLITLFFMTWDKSSPVYTYQPQLWANEAPMTCVWRWNRTVGSSHWSHVGQMLLQ